MLDLARLAAILTRISCQWSANKKSVVLNISFLALATVISTVFSCATKYVYNEDTISLLVSLSAMMLDRFSFNTPTNITRIVPNVTSTSPLPAPPLAPLLPNNSFHHISRGHRRAAQGIFRLFVFLEIRKFSPSSHFISHFPSHPPGSSLKPMSSSTSQSTCVYQRTVEGAILACAGG